MRLPARHSSLAGPPDRAEHRADFTALNARSVGKPRERAGQEVFRRADDGIRTRDPHLGKVVLYQLSHVRVAPSLSRGLPARGPETTSPPARSGKLGGPHDLHRN